MMITPNKLNISQLFVSDNEQFIVPSYQRRYAWSYKQYNALYEDIDMLLENDGHLLGMIILHTTIHTGGLNQPEIVDGQQRMTTLIILLKAFELVYCEKGNDESADKVKNLIFCKGLDGVKHPKIILGDLDNPDIRNLLIHNQLDGCTNKNIKEAYEHFYNLLVKLNITELHKLFYKVTNVAVLIRLDVGMAKDAYKLFETINNRGLRLSPTDIIKNFLLGHAAKINEDETLEKVKNLWSQIIINLDNIDTDDFLRQYMCSILKRKITLSMLVFEFKTFYLKNVKKAELLGEFVYYQEDVDANDDEDDDEDDSIEDSELSDNEEENETDNGIEKITIIQLLEKLKDLSSVYKQIILCNHDSLRINRCIKNLNNILSKPSNIFLMHFLLESKYSESEKVSVMKYIETLMLRRHICEKRTSENDDIFSKLVDFIGEDDILIKIKQFLLEKDHIPNDNDFEINFPKHLFKGILTERAKYVLEAIEYFKRGNTDELIITSSNEVHLEHIIPQTIATKKSKEEFGDWVTYLGDNSSVKHKKYVNYIGNLTLLGGKLNVQSYNNPFAKKKSSYRKSNFLITKELANLYDFKFSTVDKRGQVLTDLALQIWKI